MLFQIWGIQLNLPQCYMDNVICLIYVHSSVTMQKATNWDILMIQKICVHAVVLLFVKCKATQISKLRLCLIVHGHLIVLTIFLYHLVCK